MQSCRKEGKKWKAFWCSAAMETNNLVELKTVLIVAYKVTCSITPNNSKADFELFAVNKAIKNN